MENDAERQSSDAGDGLLDRLGLIEAQPIEQRARGFEQLHDELLQELQRADHQGAAQSGADQRGRG